MTPELMTAIGLTILVSSLYLKVSDLRKRIERLEQK